MHFILVISPVTGVDSASLTSPPNDFYDYSFICYMHPDSMADVCEVTVGSTNGITKRSTNGITKRSTNGRSKEM